MSGSNERSGFSFQLSETPPPAKTRDEAPLDELDLDLQDFGAWEAPLDTPPKDAALPLEDEPVLDFSLGKQELTPAPSESALSSSESVETQQPAAPELKHETAPGTSSATPASETKTPRIKKIQFPAKKPKASSPQLNEAAPSPPPSKPKTRFSESISAPAVASRLLDEGDSEPPPRLDESAEKNELAFPDDLPHGELGRPLNEWASETPDAKQIWQAARKTWSQGKRQAIRLGGQGFRASRALAEGVGEKLRERMEASQQEKEARAVLEQASANSELNDSGSQDAGSATPATSPRAPVPKASTGVLVRLGKATAKKLVAPLSAAAAASLVYLGGTHFLGVEGGVGLNHMSSATEIPDLGTLEEPNEATEEDDASDQGKVDRRAAAPSDSQTESEDQPQAGEMQVEIAPMPDGLSWPGKGLIEVVTSEEEVIYVDGVFTGRGPLRRIPVSPGEHEVSIRTGGTKRGGKVQVEINKNTRAVFKSE